MENNPTVTLFLSMSAVPLFFGNGQPRSFSHQLQKQLVIYLQIISDGARQRLSGKDSGFRKFLLSDRMTPYGCAAHYRKPWSPFSISPAHIVLWREQQNLSHIRSCLKNTILPQKSEAFKLQPWNQKAWIDWQRMGSNQRYPVARAPQIRPTQMSGKTR